MARKTNIGGQAVIEGVMMRGPSTVALAVRKEDGDIFIKEYENTSLTKRNKVFSLPFIRGIVALLESLTIGMKMLSNSTDILEGKENELDKKKSFKDNIALGITLVISLVISLSLFALLPTVVADFGRQLTSNTVLINLFEGVIKVIIFLSYIFFVGKLQDIKRVFQYHGAEHKTIFCYEAEKPLTVENIRGFGTLHPRCGTNFMLTVIIVGILVFSVFGWPNLVQRIILRIIMLPIIAGISYEFIKWQGKSDGKIAKILSTPGLYLQKLTTNEPDDSQIEVAIASLKAVLKEGEDDKW